MGWEAFPGKTKAIGKYHGAGPIRTTFWYGQCAEWNANFIEVATTYELIIDKYLVLCVGVVVPVQETRPRQRSRWPVKKILADQGPPHYLPTQRAARRRTHEIVTWIQKNLEAYAFRCILSSIWCTCSRDRMDTWNEQMRAMYWTKCWYYRRYTYMLVYNHWIVRALYGHRCVTSGNSNAPEVSMTCQKSIPESRWTH